MKVLDNYLNRFCLIFFKNNLVTFCDQFKGTSTELNILLKNIVKNCIPAFPRQNLHKSYPIRSIPGDELLFILFIDL